MLSSFLAYVERCIVMCMRAELCIVMCMRAECIVMRVLSLCIAR